MTDTDPIYPEPDEPQNPPLPDGGPRDGSDPVENEPGAEVPGPHGEDEPPVA